MHDESVHRVEVFGSVWFHKYLIHTFLQIRIERLEAVLEQ